MHATHDVGMAFDLGLKNFIIELNQGNPKIDGETAVTGRGWSVDHAAEWSDQYLPHVPGNDQRDALRHFLQLYALTVADNVAGNGTLEDLVRAISPASSGGNADAALKIIRALFGTGVQGQGIVDESVYVGGTVDKHGNAVNSYLQMRGVLTALGLKLENKPAHENHFHIYLRPPGPVGLPVSVIAGANPDVPVHQEIDLLDNAESLLAQIDTEAKEETKMFVLDMPAAHYVVAAAQSRQQPSLGTIGICHLSENPAEPNSAVNMLDVLRTYSSRPIARQVITAQAR